MFVTCLVKRFVIGLGVVVILLLNVMELFSVVGGSLLDILCSWSIVSNAALKSSNTSSTIYHYIL